MLVQGNSSVREYFTSEDYKAYLQNNQQWENLKKKYIYSDPTVKCWIDGKTNTLLPHHIKYKNLGHEKKVKLLGFYFWRDVIIVCFDCHTKIHFIQPFWWLRIKVPVKKIWLVKRMCLLRLIYCIRQRWFWRSVQAFLLCSVAF